MSENKPEPVKAVAKRTEVTHFDVNDPASLFMVTGVFDQLQRVALLMSNSQLVPKHLQGAVADCFLVVSQAVQWKMNPFAVAQSCYVLQGKVGYEGKLIAAVVNANPSLKTKLNYEYSGSGQQRQVRVYGTLKNEDKPREVVGTVAAWKTNNKQWETQVDQMLSYRGAREWARRHMPEAVLGVHAEEELPEIARQDTAVGVVVDSLGDVTGEVVSAQDDPKSHVIDVEAEVVKDKPKERKSQEPPQAAPDTPKLDPEDAEIDKLFS